MKITKATETERAAYRATDPVYPLYDWVQFAGPRLVYPLYGWVQFAGQRLAIEDLHGSWSAPDPVYEVMAPAGTHFVPDWTHSLLCHSLKDVTNRLQGQSLETCHCHDEICQNCKTVHPFPQSACPPTGELVA